MVIEYILRLILKVFKKNSLVNASRLVLSGLVMSLILSVIAYLKATALPDFFEIQIFTEKQLGKQEFVVAHLSDLHLTYSSSPDKLQKIVDQVNSFHPDMIVITGDLIDYVQGMPDFSLQLKQLKATHGVFSIIGNHEYYGGIDHFYDLISRSNIQLLKNENHAVTDSIDLLAVTDPQAERFNLEEPDLNKALQGIRQDTFKIFLNHRPFYFQAAVQAGVDLQLAGHTHEGQMPPYNWIVHMMYDYPYGLFQEGESYIYTTSGAGYWGPPMRFLTRNEVPIFRIQNIKK